MTNLKDIQSALYCNLSHHNFNNSGMFIKLDKKYNELDFFFDLTFKSAYLPKIFTIFTDNGILELIPTDNNKNIIPSFKTSSLDDMLYYITNKFVNL